MVYISAVRESTYEFRPAGVIFLSMPLGCSTS